MHQAEHITRKHLMNCGALNIQDPRQENTSMISNQQESCIGVGKKPRSLFCVSFEINLPARKTFSIFCLPFGRACLDSLTVQSSLLVLNPFHARHPMNMLSREHLELRLSINRIKVINASRLHHHDTRISIRHSVESAPTITTEVACHLIATLNALGVCFECAQGCCESF